ncbi:hypothetical protein HR11_00990 [Porphyromonas macacae]|uniref:Uncharacterized protein n=1 Tax=Porphyromonas macacae TaxID=28115 RepID=A0A0A2GDG1_9PORP|nr:hypothetical protein [Porphyromonas macacae]KGN76371.1 hypothetical protein HQ47_00880 [Porphyromonas macacae]KGO00483.1 hypothetical protein HR11_00990 [Porphyromonas macacae]
MVRTEIVHTKDNGDIEYKVLNYTNYLIKGLGWCIALLLACLFCFFVQKWIVSCFLNAISWAFALCAIALFGFLYRRSNLIGRAEACLVIDAIHFIVEKDAILQNQKVVNIKFFSDTLNSYGAIDEEYVLALLSDKTVLKYSIDQLNSEDKQYNHKLLKKEFSICTNDIQKQKILKPCMWSKILRSPTFVKLIIWTIIIGILAIGATVMFLILTNIQDSYDFIVLFFSLFGLLAFIPLHSYMDKKLPKNSFYNVVRFILSIPSFVLELSKLFIPFMTIIMMFVLMFAYSFLPVFLIVMGIELLGLTITLNAKLFIFLTFPFIIAAQVSGLIRNIILKKGLFSLNDHHFYFFMRELVKFLYTKENLNFIIYAGYFIFLTVSTFKALQDGAALLSQDIDLIVTKSFLVYIACTSMFDRKKSSNLEGSKLLTLLIKMLLASDDETWKQKRKSHRLYD